MRRRYGLVDPGSSASEPFRTMRLALQLRSESRSGDVILFTSAEPRAGKSTVAANYALVSSMSQNKVLLIDGDLRSPSIHSFFDIPRAPGLVELLAAGPEIRDLVRTIPGLGELHVLT